MNNAPQTIGDIAAQQEVQADTLRRAELDHQIAVAKQYPRSLAEFRDRATKMATIDKETATACFYALKRKKKGGGFSWIEGPAIRLAEIVAACYGNIDYGGAPGPVEAARTIGVGFCRDLETNSSCVKRAARRITYASGGRYGDDMIAVTTAAAISIAMRNAIFAVIPQAICKPIMTAAQNVAAGDAKTLPDTIAAALGKFAELGVAEERILAWLERKDRADIDLQDVRHLRGAYTTLREGHQTIDEMFPPVPAPGKPVRVSFGHEAPSAAAPTAEPLARNGELEPDNFDLAALKKAQTSCIEAFSKVPAPKRKAPGFTRSQIGETTDPGILATWAQSATAAAEPEVKPEPAGVSARGDTPPLIPEDEIPY